MFLGWMKIKLGLNLYIVGTLKPIYMNSEIPTVDHSKSRNKNNVNVFFYLNDVSVILLACC